MHYGTFVALKKVIKMRKALINNFDYSIKIIKVFLEIYIPNQLNPRLHRIFVHSEQIKLPLNAT